MKYLRQSADLAVCCSVVILGVSYALLATGTMMSFAVSRGHNEGPVVVTDKLKYGRGEAIKISLTNTLGHSVFSHIRSGTPIFCIKRIERRMANGEWAQLYAQCQPPHCTHDVDAPGEIKQGETAIMDWKPVAFVNGTSNTLSLEPGVYRLSISYELHYKADWKTVYTNEFAIHS